MGSKVIISQIPNPIRAAQSMLFIISEYKSDYYHTMLEKVIVTPEVWQACFNHALTTETEEIMWVY